MPEFLSKGQRLRHLINESLGFESPDRCDAETDSANQPIEYLEAEYAKLSDQAAKNRRRAENIMMNNRPKRPRPGGAEVIPASARGGVCGQKKHTR